MIKFIVNVCSVLCLIASIVLDLLIFIVIVLGIIKGDSNIYRKTLTEKRKRIIEWLMSKTLDNYMSYKMQKGRGIYLGGVMTLSMFIALDIIPERIKIILVIITLTPTIIIYFGSLKAVNSVIDYYVNTFIEDNKEKEYYDELSKKIEVGKDLLPINILVLNSVWIVLMIALFYFFDIKLSENSIWFKFSCALYTFVVLSSFVVPNYILYSLSLHYCKIKKDNCS